MKFIKIITSPGSVLLIQWALFSVISQAHGKSSVVRHDPAAWNDLACTLGYSMASMEYKVSGAQPDASGPFETNQSFNFRKVYSKSANGILAEGREALNDPESGGFGLKVDRMLAFYALKNDLNSLVKLARSAPYKKAVRTYCKDEANHGGEDRCSAWALVSRRPSSFIRMMTRQRARIEKDHYVARMTILNQKLLEAQTAHGLDSDQYRAAESEIRNLDQKCQGYNLKKAESEESPAESAS